MKAHNHIHVHNNKNTKSAKNAKDHGLPDHGFIARGKTGAVYVVRNLGAYLRDANVRTLWQDPRYVSRTTSSSMNHEAAVKIIHAPASNKDSNDTVISAAMRHIDIAASQDVANVHIVPRIYTLSVSNVPTEDGNNVYYLGMELVHGETLADYAKRFPSGLGTEVTNTVRELYRQLWSLGYVHGDPHRGNVMVLKDGQMMLIDLDFARPISSNTKRILSKYKGNDDGIWRDPEIEAAIKKDATGRNSNIAFLKRVHMPVPVRTAPIRIRMA